MANPNCPACQQKRMHKPEEWKLYHPMMGEGFTGSSWTSEAAKAAQDADEEARKAAK